MPPKSWISATRNGEANIVVGEATSASVPPVIQVNEASEIAENQCLNLPDTGPEKTMSKLPRQNEEGEEGEKSLSESKPGKAKSPSNNVEMESGEELEPPSAGKPLTDHGTDEVKPGSRIGEDGEVSRQISELPLTDHETVHVQRNEAESVEEVKRKPARQFVAGNEAPSTESYKLLSDPAADKATTPTNTEQLGSGTTVHRGN